VRTRKRFGQHFLEPAWADKVLDAIAPEPADVFLEIGPGPGVLTLRLAPKVSRLVAVEIDRDLTAALAPRLPPNATVVAGDVLETDLAQLFSTTASSSAIRIAGNLPYNVSSPILFRLLALRSERPVRDATLMLQREVAARVAAKSGTAEYGPLSVMIQWRADVTRLLTIPPAAFRPRPEVHSTLIRLTFRPPSFIVSNPVLFERMVRVMFMQRRKTLANALMAFADKVDQKASDVLREAAIDPRRRPETLQIVEIARLANAFATAGT
jgi:16S rRNA (adenine1518-N6/adenine1519-N6)-dimethyltransferase